MEALPKRRGGGVMREQRKQRCGWQEQQPAVEPLGRASHGLLPLTPTLSPFGGEGAAPRVTSRLLTLALSPSGARERAYPPTRLFPIRPQQSLRLSLRVLHRLIGRLGTGQCGLQAVVQRLGDALVVVRRELGDGVLELVARDRGRWKIGDVLLHRPRFLGI